MKDYEKLNCQIYNCLEIKEKIKVIILYFNTQVLDL